MYYDFDNFLYVIGTWKEDIEESLLPRDFNLPHIDGDDGDD